MANTHHRAPTTLPNPQPKPLKPEEIVRALRWLRSSMIWPVGQPPGLGGIDGNLFLHNIRRKDFWAQYVPALNWQSQHPDDLFIWENSWVTIDPQPPAVPLFLKYMADVAISPAFSQDSNKPYSVFVWAPMFWIQGLFPYDTAVLLSSCFFERSCL